MKNVIALIFSGFVLFSASSLFAQDNVPSCLSNAPQYAAVFFNNKMLSKGCGSKNDFRISSNTKGLMKVSSIDFLKNYLSPQKNIGFKIAVKNDETNTIRLLSEETFYEVEIQEILEKCPGEDKLILMTVEPQYALPQHEIEIVWGC